MKIKRELKIGIYFVVTLVALYWGFNFLKGRDIFGKVNNLYAVYEDVEGLQTTSQVFMKGLKIGTVKAIRLDDDNASFIVELQIKSKFNIPDNSVAHLYSSDIMGNKAIRIFVGDSPVYFADKSFIATEVDSDLTSILKDELMPLKEKVETLLNELNITFKSINTVLDERTTLNLSNGIESLSNTLANLDQISGTLAKNRGSLTASLSNVESITSNLKNNNEKISNIIENFSALSDSLKKVELASTVNELRTVLAQVNSGSGTVGKLMQNDSLYNNLSNSLQNLDLLLEDFRTYPKRYINVSVFGKKDPKIVKSETVPVNLSNH